MSAINNIKEEKGITADSSYLLAESNYNIISTFKTRNRSEIVTNTPIESAIKSDIDITTGNGEEKQSASNKFTFDLLSATDYQLCDLKDVEFNISAQVYIPLPTLGSSVKSNASYPDPPRLGNLALLGLFQNAELYIDSTLIERNLNPGLSANNDYALRYPHSIDTQRLNERFGFIKDLKYTYNKTEISNVENEGNSSIVWHVGHNKAVGESGDPTSFAYIGFIQQKIKLSDIFQCVYTLPPLFNHKVSVNLTRYSTNIIPCSIPYSANSTTTTNTLNYATTATSVNLSAFINFKANVDVYQLTDEAISQMKTYYSKPIETLFTQCKQFNQTITSLPTASSNQTINISVDSAYKNKLLTIAIPRFTNLQDKPKQDATSGDKLSSEANKRLDTVYSPTNSYTYGGLRSLTVYTANGVKLFGFDMARDGTISGVNATPEKSFLNMINAKTTGPAEIYNYTEVYNQYLKAREHFGQLPEEGLDFVTFMKEYCIYCVDLSPFAIAAGENIRVEFTCAPWEEGYNPFYYHNDSEGGPSMYKSKNFLINFYSDKVLRLLPDRRVELADMFAPKGEADLTNVN